MRYYELIKEIYDDNTEYHNIPPSALKMMNSKNKLTPVCKISDMNLFKYDDNGSFCYGLFDKDTIISFLEVGDYNQYNLPMIILSWCDTEYRGKGIMKDIIQIYVENNNSLYTDIAHTESAKNMWKKILSNGLSNFKIVIRNITTGTQELYDKSIHDEHHIWGNSDILIGLIK